MNRPIRAVLDANVLISALLKPESTPGMLYRAARDDAFELILSAPILAELADVLRRPKFDDYPVSAADRDAYIAALPILFRVVPAAVTGSHVPQDPNDEHLVAAALAARADYLVTGDKKHLLPLREVMGVKIVSPAEFKKILDARAKR